MIDDIILSWLSIFTIGDLVVMWLTTSLVAYLLTRRSYRIREWSWDHADALLMVFLCVIAGPLVMFFAAVCNLRSKALSDWLCKPSRW
jgi:purine-cytosine permease-like protein